MDDNKRPRDVLAENLQKLMAASPHRTIEKLVAAGGGTTGTLDRIRRVESATGVDNLAPLAEVFGLREPWMLLVPGIEATEATGGKPQVRGLPQWPFTRIDQARYDQLDEADKAFVQGELVGAIKQCEARATQKPTPTPPAKQPRKLPGSFAKMPPKGAKRKPGKGERSA